jgi:hypothetical protein
MYWYFGTSGDGLPDEIEDIAQLQRALTVTPTMYDYGQIEQVIDGLSPDGLLMTAGYGKGDAPHPAAGDSPRTHMALATEASYARKIDVFTYAARRAMAREIPVRIADASREESQFIKALVAPRLEPSPESKDDIMHNKRWLMLGNMLREESAYSQFIGQALIRATPRKTPRRISLLWDRRHYQHMQERAEADGLNVEMVRLGVKGKRERRVEIMQYISTNGLLPYAKDT